MSLEGPDRISRKGCVRRRRGVFKCQNGIVRHLCRAHPHARVAVRVLWTDPEDAPRAFRRLRREPRRRLLTNHVPGLLKAGLLSKASLTRLLLRRCGGRARAPDFVLPLWDLSDSDECKLLLADPPLPLVVKPADDNHGNGLVVVARGDVAAADAALRAFVHTRSIAQAYVDRPLLDEAGHKFDFRVLFGVLRVTTQRAIVCVCDEGLVRTCAEPYDSRDAANARSHFTNTAINHTPKRLASEVLSTLGVDAERFWRSVRDMIAHVVRAVHEDVLKRARRVFDADEDGDDGGKRGPPEALSRCFQVLGLDVLLTHQHRAVLLEVNHNPSLALRKSPVDTRVKMGLMSALVRALLTPNTTGQRGRATKCEEVIEWELMEIDCV